MGVKVTSKYHVYRDRMITGSDGFTCTMTDFLDVNGEYLDPGEIIDIILMLPGERFYFDTMHSCWIERIT